MILIIDDDRAVRSSLGLLLRQAGYAVEAADSPDSAMDVASRSVPDLFVLDMNFSMATTGEEGLNLLKNIRDRWPDKPVILITAWGSIELAVEGMKSGAADFITKPWNNKRFLESVQTTLSLSNSGAGESAVSYSRDTIDEQYDFSNLIGEDLDFVSVLETAGRVSVTDASVLITGDSGTGKELLAEAIHVNSRRSSGPFVKVNLGGIPASLFETEMFGHRKGAFTDARQDRRGRFELSDTGTLFLDEIGDLDLSSQVKLLRVLQDKCFEVLGSSTTKSVDFRLICATNRDLEGMLQSKTFREDLYYRINLITLRLPALRERSSDIPNLVCYFTSNLRTLYGRHALTVTPEALKWLAGLRWPGNVRELKNVVERTVLVTDKDELDIEHFKEQMRQTTSPAQDSRPAIGTVTIEEMEKTMIEEALELHDRNISKVAQSLGISRAALYRRLDKHGIEI
jgi:two-component system NtrC family response regulator